jgi:hypothetical protein
MKPRQTLTLIFPQGQSVWRVADCVLWFRPTRHERVKKRWKGTVHDVVLNIEATGDAIEGDEDYVPCAIVSWFMRPFSPDLLVGKTFEIPKAYDEVARDHLVDLCYYEHLDVDENRVEFLGRAKNTFHVRWTGVMQNPGAPDDSNIRLARVVADFSAKLVDR